MTHKELREHGLNEYRIKQLRATQKELSNINALIYETSTTELTAYDLGNLNDEDIIVQFENQEQFDDINDFVRARINNIRAEKETVEQTGHTLNFIQNLPDYEAALKDYTREEILQMSKQERLAALQSAYKDIFGKYADGSDEEALIRALQ